MPVLSSQQGHLLALVSTTSGDDSAEIGPGIGDDVINLPGSVPFSRDVFQPVALAAVVANRIPAGGGERLIPTSLDNVRPRFIRDRSGDDVAGRVFGGGRSCVVRQAKDLGRVGFQPLLDAFGRETGKLPEASFIFGQSRKDLDPTLRKRTFVDDKATGVQCGECIHGEIGPQLGIARKKRLDGNARAIAVNDPFLPCEHVLTTAAVAEEFP